MFKHITPFPWSAYGLTVWGYETEHGQPQVASCRNINMPNATQRANARLMAIAPQMFEIIQKMHGNEEAMRLVAYMEKNHDE